MWKRLQQWWNRERLAAELDEEIRTHLEMSGGEGFGNQTLYAEDARAAWGWPAIETLLQDVRYALRGLARNKLFAALGIAALAIGIGGNTAIFSLVYSVLLRPLPFADPDRLVLLFIDSSEIGFPRNNISPADYRDFERRTQSYERVAAFAGLSLNLTGDGSTAERVKGLSVTPGFFSVLGVQPIRGREFTESEGREGHGDVVMISHGLWQRRFGGADVVGRQIMLNETSHTVVGIVPAGFQFWNGEGDLWRPLVMTDELWRNRGARFVHAVGRMKSGVSLAAAQAEARDLGVQLERENAGFNLKLFLAPVQEHVTHEVRRSLFVLLAAVASVLLIACANVTHLLLARILRRGHEFGVRLALGAGRSRLIRQLLTENLVLAIAGGVAGLALARMSFPLLSTLIPETLTDSAALRMDWQVMAMMLGVAVLAAFLCGVIPALRVSGQDASAGLHGSGGTRSIGDLHGGKVRGLLISAEMAVAVVLLITAVLLIQTFLRVRDMDAGFRTDGVLTMETDLAPSTRAPERRLLFYDEVIQRVKALPGVRSAAYASAVPLTWKGGTSSFSPDGREDRNIDAMNRQVTPAYFATYGISILRGRGFNDDDRGNTMPVCVINETLAARAWAGEDPIGKRFRTGGSRGPWFTVVGLARDVKEMGLTEPVKGVTYYPATQGPARFTDPQTLAVRISGDVQSLIPAIRGEILAVNPNQTISRVRMFSEVVDRELSERRTYTSLLGAFAATALLLACLGIYGVTGYAVEQRTREIGVRLALGAGSRAILGMVMGATVPWALVGLAVGLLGAAAMARVMRTMLYDVRPFDPFTFTAVPVLVLAVVILATLVPALRSLRIDPLKALRTE